MPTAQQSRTPKGAFQIAPGAGGGNAPSVTARQQLAVGIILRCWAGSGRPVGLGITLGGDAVVSATEGGGIPMTSTDEHRPQRAFGIVSSVLACHGGFADGGSRRRS